MTTPHDWRERARCGRKPGPSPELFFSDSEREKQLARRWCRTCPVRIACLEDALIWESQHSSLHRAGIYGGFSPKERASIAAQVGAA